VKKFASLFCTIFVFLLISLPSRAQLTYEGSSSIGNELLPELAKAFEKKTGTSFKSIKPSDSADGFKAVKDGTAAIGGLSRLMTSEEMSADLGNKVIGYDAIVVYVHKDNPVKNLSIENLKKIFLGEVKNWKEVGGNDGPIEIVLKKEGITGGTMKQFTELILEGRALAAPQVSFSTHREDIAYVASHPNAVTFASLAFDEKLTPFISIENVYPSREALNRGEYVLARPFVLVYRTQPEDPMVTAFLDFALSEEGQAIVKKYVIPVVVSDK